MHRTAFEQISACFRVADLKKVFDAAARAARWVKARCCSSMSASLQRAQQDSFLPVMEDAPCAGRRTTENRIELNAACCRGACWCFTRSMRRDRKLFVHAEKIEGKKLPLDDEARPCWCGWPTAMRAADAGRRSLARCP